MLLARGGGRVTWAEALDAFERDLDDLEQRLRNGVWEGVQPGWNAGPAPADPPSPEQRERAVSLLARMASCREVLAAAVADTRGQLQAVPRRRSAAAAYR